MSGDGRLGRLQNEATPRSSIQGFGSSLEVSCPGPYSRLGRAPGLLRLAKIWQQECLNFYEHLSHVLEQGLLKNNKIYYYSARGSSIVF